MNHKKDRPKLRMNNQEKTSCSLRIVTINY